MVSCQIYVAVMDQKQLITNQDIGRVLLQARPVLTELASLQATYQISSL